MRITKFSFSKRAVLLLALAANLTCTATSTAHQRHRVRPPRDYSAWSRVNVCEEGGGWRVPASYTYPDPIGLTRANLEQFGGHPLPPGPTSMAERVLIIKVADRFIKHYGMSVPDQHGCQSGGW